MTECCKYIYIAARRGHLECMKRSQYNVQDLTVLCRQAVLSGNSTRIPSVLRSTSPSSWRD